MAIEVIQIGGTLGAEILGIRIDNLQDNDIATVKRSLLRHRVVVLRDQLVEPRIICEFAAQFGELRPIQTDGAGQPVECQWPEYPCLSLIDTYGRANEWHTDQSFFVEPNLMTLLQCEQPSEIGGATTWINTTSAFRNLSTRMQQYLVGLTAVHTARNLGDPEPKAVHPVIRKRAQNNEPSLYINRMFTERIVELDRREGAAVLSYLFDHIEQPHFSFTWYWKSGDVVLWDNTSTAHVGHDDYASASTRRLLHIGVLGDYPVPFVERGTQ